MVSDLDTKTVLTERKGNILLITLNRPEAMNALTGEVLDDLAAAFKELNNTPALKVGVITGAGHGFCAGMDLKVYLEKGAPEQIFQLFQAGSEKPLVAAVENFALAGGLEVALLCDLIVASEGAKLGIPEVTVGLFAGAGGLLRLPARLGYSIAAELALTGAPITAEQAQAWGLVNRVVAKGSALDEAMNLAGKIAQNASFAVRTSKKIMQASIGAPERDGWAFQARQWAQLIETKDATEGPRAFAEKRAPSWSDS
jgi:enoyl-CoA hydratase